MSDIKYTDEQLDNMFERFNRAMFDVDPMNTCCGENECYEEYARIADAAVNYVLEGHTRREAIAQALKDSFEELVEPQQVDAVMMALEAR
ncbi:hypothetical protein [Pseudidiomarina insulisalsae]|uniref:Uncharacterized protein n=1 Tax=Pseudidiomarina insulisalsae TaxID=575789 RepID=A0A432YMK1_9GAMM|nr:hypothetical protein [Pseudidiomarina insulisalsae]RUO62219.1 hypothetical protein CWI71_05045 [Pseudidiomarina insulisalsae]